MNNARRVALLVPVIGGSGGVAPPSTLLTGLVSYWKLDEPSDGSGAITRNDSVTASANNLTDANTTASGTGKVGLGADFEAANNEYLVKTDTATLSVGNIDFTFALWCNFESAPGSNTGRTLISKYVAQKEYLLLWENLSGNTFLKFVVSPDGTATTVLTATAFGTPATATWYFIVAWHDATANKIYLQVNNGTIYEAAHTTGVFDGNSSFYLGSLDNAVTTYRMDGLIDEVGFWKKVLTEAERTALYNGGSGATYPF